MCERFEVFCLLQYTMTQTQKEKEEKEEEENRFRERRDAIFKDLVKPSSSSSSKTKTEIRSVISTKDE